MPFDNKMLAALRAMGIGSGGGGSGGGGEIENLYIFDKPSGYSNTALFNTVLAEYQSGKDILMRVGTSYYYLYNVDTGTPKTLNFIRIASTGGWNNVECSVYQLNSYGSLAGPSSRYVNNYSFPATTTATAADLAKGVTAYTNKGVLLTGTHEDITYPTAEEASF